MVRCEDTVLTVWFSSIRPWWVSTGSRAFWEFLEGSREQLQRSELGLGKVTRPKGWTFRRWLPIQARKSMGVKGTPRIWAGVGLWAWSRSWGQVFKAEGEAV